MISELGLVHALQKQNRAGGGLELRAVRLFERIVRDPKRGHIRKLLGVHITPLRRLADVADERRLSSRRYAGLRAIPVDAIHGTLNRAADFDHDFRPLQESDLGRWANIATAMMHGVDLPPIEVVQVGADYYVKDGHHRISVARALGFRYLDAVVEVWGEG